MRSLSKLICLTACLVSLSSCSPEETAESNEQATAPKQSAAPIKSTPEPKPSPLIFKRYDLKGLHQEVVANDAQFKAAIAQKSGNLLAKAEDTNKALLKKIEKIDQSFHPLNPVYDCKMAVIDLFAAKAVMFSSATGEDPDETSKRIYQSNLADFTKAMADCQTSAKTYTSAAFRAEKPEEEIRFVD